MHWFQHGCREAALLVSKALDSPLTRTEGLRLAWHLWRCGGCKNFSRQLQLMHKAGARWRAYSEQE